MNLLLVLSLIGLDYRPAFLEIPSFGRATALGGAYTAAGTDAVSLFYNPAAAEQDALQFALTDWLVGTRVASGAGALGIRNVGNIAAGMKYLSYGTMSRWDEAGSYIGDFSAYDLQAKLGFRRSIAGFVSVGAGLGLLDERVDSTSLTTLTGDFGARFDWRWLAVGIAARDFAGTRAPFAKALALAATPFDWLLLTTELEYVADPKVKAGAELRWSQFALRGGYDGANPVAGFGLNVGRASVDYAVVFHSKLGLVHQLSVGVFR
jgi:hypothetical protein